MNYKKKQNVILLTTVYPGIENYFNDFISSVNAQENSNFQLVIINDNFKNLESYLTKININKTHVFSSKQSPEKNRIYGIKKCKQLKCLLFLLSDPCAKILPNRCHINLKSIPKAPS